MGISPRKSKQHERKYGNKKGTQVHEFRLYFCMFFIHNVMIWPSLMTYAWMPFYYPFLYYPSKYIADLAFIL